MKTLSLPLSILLSCLFVLTACDETPQQEQPSAQADRPTFPQDTYRQIETSLIQQAKNQRNKLLAANQGFQDAIQGLLTDPSQARLQQARTAWQVFYQHFNEQHYWLQLAAQVDRNNHLLLARTDLFPIFPGYIDRLEQWPFSGIVNDVTVPLDRDSLIAQNGLTDQQEASLGFQVIHFLLHGEQQQPRSYDEFLPTPETIDQTQPAHEKILPQDSPNQRRRTYLRTATQLLTDDIASLLNWYQSASGFEQQFSSQTDKQRARLLFITLIHELNRIEALQQLQDHADAAAGDYLHPQNRQLAIQASTGTLLGVLAGNKNPANATGLVTLIGEKSEETAHKLEQQLADLQNVDGSTQESSSGEEAGGGKGTEANAVTRLKGTLRQGASLLEMRL